jgi:hypothetical protein
LSKIKYKSGTINVEGLTFGGLIMGVPLEKDETLAWRQAYLEYKADPTDQRTLEQFADDNCIEKSAVYKWAKLNREENAKRIANLRSKYSEDLRSRAWKRLDERMEKDTKAISLVFQLLGDLVERKETTVDFMGPSEKKERIKKLLDEIRQKAEGKTSEDGSTSPGGSAAS